MRKLILGFMFVLVAAQLPALGTGAQAQAQDATRPNVVLVIMDDVGYGDYGSYGAPDIKTPNVDSLAKDGTKLTDFYAAPSCSPTRAALISGRYQQRYRIEVPLGTPPRAGGPGGGAATPAPAAPAGPAAAGRGAAPGRGAAAPVPASQGLVATGRSLPQLLKNNGYRTALIGKWHLGYSKETSPGAHGFDYFFGLKSGLIDYYQHTDQSGNHDLYENEEHAHVQGYSTDLFTQKSIKFIEESAGTPFFLEVAYNAAHWPFQVPDQPSVAPGNGRFVQPQEQASTRADYVKILERADQGLGQILATLEKRGLTKNTLVIFTNDNGGEWLSRNAPLFHKKQSVWEGGVRVPLLMKWPGRIPAKQTSKQVGIVMDLTATVLAATGSPVPPGAKLEGIDLLPLLQKGAKPAERTLYFRYTLATRRQRAVRQGDWKLMIDGPNNMLFNLAADPGERNDLAASRQDMMAKLFPLIGAWEADVDAEAKVSQ
jgi:arylsulfatase A-like enzyme